MLGSVISGTLINAAYQFRESPYSDDSHSSSVMGAHAADCGNGLSINPFDPYKCGKILTKG